jgi:hypothetical protein
MQKIDNEINSASAVGELPEQMTFSYRSWLLAFAAVFPAIALCATLRLEFVLMTREANLVFQFICALLTFGLAMVSWSYVRCLCQAGAPIIVLSADGILYGGSELPYKKQFVPWSEVGSLAKDWRKGGLDIVIHFKNPNSGKHWTRMPIMFLHHAVDVLPFATRYLAGHDAIAHCG